MAQLDTQILPLLPLTSGVVLPGMVVTLTIEFRGCPAGIAASESSDGELLLVPKVQGCATRRSGPSPRSRTSARLRNGLEALVIRGVHRSVVGTGVAGTGDGVWVQHEPRLDPETSTERARARPRVPRDGREHRRGARGPRGRRLPPRDSDPGQIADTAGYSPDLSVEQKVEILETLDVEQRLEKALAVGEGGPRRARAEGPDPQRRPRRHGEEPARVHPAPADGRDPQGARRGVGRRRIGEAYREKIAEARIPEAARRRGRARARPARAHPRAVARVRMDPHVPRLDDRDPVGTSRPRKTTSRSPMRGGSSTKTTPA